MKDIDRMIRDALKKEDAELLEKVGTEQKMHEAILDLFRGRSKWLSFATLVATLLLMFLAVFAILKFYRAPELRTMLQWGTVAFFSLMAIGAVKIWAWLEMAKNEIMREVKRTELQIAYLSKKLSESEQKTS